MNFHRIPVLVGLTLVAGCGSGSGTDPLRPYLVPWNGFPTMPDHARAVSPEEFVRLVDEGEVSLVTPAILVQWSEDEAARRAAARARAFELYADRPDLLLRHTVEPDPNDPRVRALGDGNYAFDHGGNGDPRQVVVVHGPHVAFQDLVDSTTTFNDLANQLAIYERWYEQFPDARLDPDRFPSPERLGDLVLTELIALNDDLALGIAEAYEFLDPCTVPPPGRPASWLLEEGCDPAIGGDINGSAGPLNLAAQACYPLKWLQTATKSQGNRGSCTSFAVTAAVECVIARDYGQWVNLSEQMLYNRSKQAWQPSTYGDGSNASIVLNMMFLSGFQYPFEFRWDYNPSNNRIDVGSFYLNSCAPYMGEQCSDANHQADEVCTTVNGWTYCAYAVPPSSIPGDSDYGILPATSILDPGIVGITWAKACLLLGDPLVFSVTVPSNSMDSDPLETSGGYVPFFAFEGNIGAHCMLLVGWVPNALLPLGAPPGDGGGYFIVKNSWGSNYGDGGYIYVSADWFALWTTGIYRLSQVTHP
jgi:hypothetical protein